METGKLEIKTEENDEEFEEDEEENGDREDFWLVNKSYNRLYKI